MRLREAILKVAHELIGIIAEKDGGNAFLGRCDQYGAERSLANRKFDLLVGAARAVLRRSHAEHIGRLLVEAPARIEAGVVNRFGDQLPDASPCRTFAARCAAA